MKSVSKRKSERKSDDDQVLTFKYVHCRGNDLMAVVKYCGNLTPSELDSDCNSTLYKCRVENALVHAVLQLGPRNCQGALLVSFYERILISSYRENIC
jgi:hypothetical protein